MIAFTLNPLVRDLQRLKLPRGLSVAVVSVIFATAFIGLLVALGTVVVSETRSAAERIDTYLTEESSLTGQTGVEVDVDRLQAWLDDHGLEGIRIEEQLDDLTESIGAGDVSGYVQDAISFAQGAALSVILFLFSAVLVVVISIYMLLDMPRLERSIDRRFPPHGGLPLTQRIERALWGYVKGQAILSVVIGTSAGVGMWILGTTGLVEGAEQYALLFGLWTAFIEVIPYIGPWLSAVPPAIYALVVDPVGVLWVAALFVFIYQVEGHVVVPNVMASALRLHPLLVIFGLLAGGALYGIPGVLVALPTMAAGRAIWEFFGDRIDSSRGRRGGAVPVEVELEPPGPPTPREEPPRAASARLERTGSRASPAPRSGAPDGRGTLAVVGAGATPAVPSSRRASERPRRSATLSGREGARSSLHLPAARAAAGTGTWRVVSGTLAYDEASTVAASLSGVRACSRPFRTATSTYRGSGGAAAACPCFARCRGADRRRRAARSCSTVDARRSRDRERPRRQLPVRVRPERRPPPVGIARESIRRTPARSPIGEDRRSAVKAGPATIAGRFGDRAPRARSPWHTPCRRTPRRTSACSRDDRRGPPRARPSPPSARSSGRTAASPRQVSGACADVTAERPRRCATSASSAHDHRAA